MGQIEFLPYGLLILGVIAVLFAAVLWGLRQTMLGRSRVTATVAGTILLGALIAASNAAGVPVSAVGKSLPMLAGLSFWIVNEDLFDPGVLLRTFALVLAVIGIGAVLFGHSLHAILALTGSGALVYLVERLPRPA